MERLIFVEELKVGDLIFKGYIVAYNEHLLSYSIFVNEFNEAFLDILANKNSRKVNLEFNPIMIEFLLEHKPADRALREKYFNEIYSFILESERKASYLIFKNETLNYVKKSKLIVQLKKLYIND